MKLNLDEENLKFLADITREKFEILFPEHKKTKITAELCGYFLQTKVFQMEFDSDVHFYFKNNFITQIVVVPSNMRLDYDNFNANYSFDKYNEALKKLFGKSSLSFLARNKTWRLKNFTIKHYLFERFCLEERIEINFK